MKSFKFHVHILKRPSTIVEEAKISSKPCNTYGFSGKKKKRFIINTAHGDIARRACQCAVQLFESIHLIWFCIQAYKL